MKNPIIDAVLAEEAGAELEMISARDEAAARWSSAQEEAKQLLEMARQDAAAAMRQAKAQAQRDAEKAEEAAQTERLALCEKLREETGPRLNLAAEAVLAYLG